MAIPRFMIYVREKVQNEEIRIFEHQQYFAGVRFTTIMSIEKLISLVTIPYWLTVFTISFNLNGCSSAGASARKGKITATTSWI